MPKRNRDDEYFEWVYAQHLAQLNTQPPGKRTRRGAESGVVAQPHSQPSSSRQPGPSQGPPATKSRKETDGETPVPEKRGAIFKKACPKNILERVERVMSQRFYMIDRNRSPEEVKETFSVLGSTGNVYTVTINLRPSCNCPDALKGNHCKHILFIFLKVLQVPQSSHVWYQKALLTSELETIFAEAPLAPNSVAHSHVREAHAKATGKLSVDTEPANKKRIPGPDDDCPICYDGMHGVDEKLLTFCVSCGNALHEGCFDEWKASTRRLGKDLTCVWCRARWVTVSNGGDTSAGITSEGYLNLSHISGNSPVRDTSTYYHGPRRGRRYYDSDYYEDSYSFL